MGCQPSSNTGQFEKSEFDNIWKKMNSFDDGGKGKLRRSSNERRWQILRLILVTTFKDFKNERKGVLELIETRIQEIASEKQIFVQIEDLSYGSKANLDESSSVYLIEKLAKEAKKSRELLIYVHFLGECCGFQIGQNFGDREFMAENGISVGQTMTEILLHFVGIACENSIFLHRNPSFLSEIPFNVTNFIDAPPKREHAQYLAETLKNTTPSSKFFEYSVKTRGINNTHFKQIVFESLEDANKPIEKLINRVLDQFSYSIDDDFMTASELIDEYYRNLSSGQNKLVIEKIQVALKTSQIVAIFGDYGSGKTTVTRNLNLKNSLIITGRSNMTEMQFRKILDSKFKKLENPENIENHFLIIDDFNEFGKDVQKALISEFSGKFQMILTTRKRKIAVPEDSIFIELQSMDMDDVLEMLTLFIKSSVKASNILKISRMKRRKSLGSVEGSKNDFDICGWTPLKCRIIGQLCRNGSSEEKCAQLGQLSISRVVEADICLLECDEKGHLLISTLCFLSILETGLNEIELRCLLASEFSLLPIGLRGSLRSLPFEYCADVYGKSPPQIPPLRWWYVLNRLDHIWTCVDESTNHFVLPAVCRKIIGKRYLKTSTNLEHFKKRMKTVLIERSDNWLKHRKREIDKQLNS